MFLIFHLKQLSPFCVVVQHATASVQYATAAPPDRGIATLLTVAPVDSAHDLESTVKLPHSARHICMRLGERNKAATLSEEISVRLGL